MSEPRPTTRTDYAERILRVLLHIQHNLDRDLSLAELADIAHFSPFHFHRVFRGQVGESVMQHIRRLRLERAAMRLKNSDRPVTELAFEAGYEAHEAFTRAFHSAFGCSPSDYRAAGAAAELDTPTAVHFIAAGRDMNFTPISLESNPMDVEIKELPLMRVAFIRHTGPYEQCGATWGKLCGWMGMKGLFGPNVRMFGASYDDPEITPVDKIRYDACATVPESVEAEGEVGIQEFGGGKWAVTMHEGPYENFKDTYAALYGRWFAESEYEPGDSPTLEFYLNDPNTTPPAELRTEIWVRLRD
ncbi:MAG: GyrI-like domain-containing protein [Phycisphaerales bacterium JB038]